MTSYSYKSQTYIIKHGISVHPELVDFVEHELLPDLNLNADQLWRSIADSIAILQGKNVALLETRSLYQQQINDWIAQGNDVGNQPAYIKMLREIGYLRSEPAQVSIATQNLDPEVSEICAAQLVVPVDNARYALNAANARWGSLYDSLYSTDVLTDSLVNGFDRAHALRVIAYVNSFLDSVVPLESGRYEEILSFAINNHQLDITTTLGKTSLRDSHQFVGYRQDESGRLTNILLVNNRLHIDLYIDPEHPAGRLQPSALCDVQLESALTTVQDLEDSVSAVDSSDKIRAWRNWLRLMQGSLTVEFSKDGSIISRSLNDDRHYTAADGSELIISGRSLLFVRNVGLLMRCDCIIDGQGQQVYEGILDGWITTLCAMHNQREQVALKNSKTGSVYIVKPKLHGEDEVAFVCRQFDLIEAALGLAKNTVKIGLMDEERRTSANLKACIHAARERIFFINTGFLDRTGDEIHTSMLAGVMPRKADMKQASWLSSYEQRNVAIGLDCGFSSKAQIGKGMWAMPDRMNAMLKQKVAHPQSGANCSWVPSPTAATLHAMHYHQHDVLAIQRSKQGTVAEPLEKLLEVPLVKSPDWSTEDIGRELDSNIQSILGYVVRWVDQGVGCSKVPDLNNVALMEDRATLRISSQHLANWLHHGMISIEQIDDSLKRMARVVDKQNTADSNYQQIDPATSLAFACARDLIVKAKEQPNGYTESLLHAYRLRKKCSNSLQSFSAHGIESEPVESKSLC